MFSCSKIVCPVDFSDISTEALRTACDLRETFDAAIVLLHIVEPIIAPSDFAFGPLTTRDIEEKLTGRSRQSILELASRLNLPAGKWSERVERGRASEEVVRVAMEEEADLIVMATHGYTGMAHVLLGSTAERVLRKAPCPVLTIRTGGKRKD